MNQDGPNRWMELCKAAESELDPKKLMDLISEIIRALDERDEKQRIAVPLEAEAVDAP